MGLLAGFLRGSMQRGVRPGLAGLAGLLGARVPCGLQPGSGLPRRVGGMLLDLGHAQRKLRLRLARDVQVHVPFCSDGGRVKGKVGLGDGVDGCIGRVETG